MSDIPLYLHKGEQDVGIRHQAGIQKRLPIVLELARGEGGADREALPHLQLQLWP